MVEDGRKVAVVVGIAAVFRALMEAGVLYEYISSGNHGQGSSLFNPESPPSRVAP